VLRAGDELKSGQDEHASEAMSEKVCTGHAWHMSSESERVLALAFPATHSRHEVAALTPVAVVYFPVPQ